MFVPLISSVWRGGALCYYSRRATSTASVILLNKNNNNNSVILQRVFHHINNTITTTTGAAAAATLTTTHNYHHKTNIYDVLSTMPKKVDLKDLQEHRMARKIKSRKYPPSSVYLQVLGAGATGGPRGLYVFTEQARYLFNCGEGTQRLAHEHKVKLSTMEHILVTYKSWENVGGLPGMLLTLQDTGVPEITLHGPPGIDSLYFDTRFFLRFRDLKIRYSHYKNNTYQQQQQQNNSEPLIIKTVPLWAQGEEEEEEETVREVKKSENLETQNDLVEDEAEDLFAHEKTLTRKRPHIHTHQHTDPGNPILKKQRQEESTACKRLSIAYICRPPPKAGALKLEECVRAGVPPGPLLGELKKGNDITLDSGKVVRAVDVTSPDDPGPVFIVVEAPSDGYLDSLLHSTAFSAHQSGGSEEDLAEVVVHFTPARVMATPRYRQWMALFPATTTHIAVNEDSNCMGSEAVHRIQYKLGLLSDRLFPLLKDDGIPVKEGTEATETRNGDASEREEGEQTREIPLTGDNRGGSNGAPQEVIGPFVQAKTLLKYHIRPRLKLNRSSELCLTPKTYIQECYEGENFESALSSVKERLRGMEEKEEEEGREGTSDYPCITFLGTGSCIPNKTRNTSSILLEMSPDKALIMDCGEGTYGQLVRLLGGDGCDALLRRVMAVYVSHLHADHHIGFIRLLLARRKAFVTAGRTEIPKLLLLAPVRIMPYLKSYHDHFEEILEDFTLVPNRELVYNRSERGSSGGSNGDSNSGSGSSSGDSSGSGISGYRELCEQLEMKEIAMTYVIHCPNSFGVAWTHKDGWKIAYSGDTMPCQGLVHIGKDCDLLIHEATMEDELEEDAKIKTHSTTSQAIQVGREMKAKNTLLTHFSQRYAKVPLLSTLPDRVGIAFDNMKVSLRDLPSLQPLYEALVAMFSEDYDEMLEKTAKKRRAKERLKEHLESLESDAQTQTQPPPPPPSTKNDHAVEVVNSKSGL